MQLYADVSNIVESRKWMIQEKENISAKVKTLRKGEELLLWLNRHKHAPL